MKTRKTESGGVVVRSEAAVVAEIEDGRCWDVLRTNEGLRYCRAEDLSDPGKWRVCMSVQDLASRVHHSNLCVRIAGNPNAPTPTIDKKFDGFRNFHVSGIDLINSGTSQVITRGIGM